MDRKAEIVPDKSLRAEEEVVSHDYSTFSQWEAQREVKDLLSRSAHEGRLILGDPQTLPELPG